MGRSDPADPTSSDQTSNRFLSFYETNYAAIYRFVLRRLVGGHDDASDVTAEVFATAWRRFDQIPMPPHDRLWLYGVARKVMSRHQRGAWRRSRLLRRLEDEAIGSSSEDLSDNTFTDRQLVQHAIARLRPADRDVLSLVLWEQLSHAEAARVLGCSVNAVGLRLHRARSRLRAELAIDEGRLIEPRGGRSPGNVKDENDH